MTDWQKALPHDKMTIGHSVSAKIKSWWWITKIWIFLLKQGSSSSSQQHRENDHGYSSHLFILCWGHTDFYQFFQTYSTVVANTGCLPASIVAAGVTLIQLETVVFVPTHVEQGNAKRSLSCKNKPHRKQDTQILCSYRETSLNIHNLLAIFKPENICYSRVNNEQ